MSELTIPCFKCGETIDISSQTPILRSTVCPKCNVDLHVCKTCVHFDPMKHNECEEPIAERIVNKEKSNYCDYYRVNRSGTFKKYEKSNLRSAADELFKK